MSNIRATDSRPTPLVDPTVQTSPPRDLTVQRAHVVGVVAQAFKARERGEAALEVRLLIPGESIQCTAAASVANLAAPSMRRAVQKLEAIILLHTYYPYYLYVGQLWIPSLRLINSWGSTKSVA